MRLGCQIPGGAAFGELVPASVVRPAGYAQAPSIAAQWPGTRRPTRPRRSPVAHCATRTVGATCRIHCLDLDAVCTANMTSLAVPQLLPAPCLIPSCLRAAPDMAGPVTRCAFPTGTVKGYPGTYAFQDSWTSSISTYRVRIHSGTPCRLPPMIPATTRMLGSGVSGHGV